MTNLTVILPPDGEPVSLASAKAFLRIGHEGEDALIADLIQQARARVEQVSGLALVTRTVSVVMARWPAGIAGRGMRLPCSPTTSLIAVRTVDSEGVVMDQSGRFRLECGRVCLRPWSMVPAVSDGGRVEIDFEAGFGLTADVPEDLQEAVLRMVGALYATRAPSGFEFENGKGDLPRDVQAILDARREVRL